MAEFEAPAQQQDDFEGVTLETTQYKLRLSKESYRGDLQDIRDGILENGSKQVLREIELIYDPYKPSSVSIKVFLNFAFQSNSSQPSCNASLNMLVFEDVKASQWCFKIKVDGLAIPGTQLPMDGSYKEFGYPGDLPTISLENLRSAILNISGFTGKVNDAIKTDLVRVVITICDAIRIQNVAIGMFGALCGTPYKPDAESIRSWGGHTLGEYNFFEDQ